MTYVHRIYNHQKNELHEIYRNAFKDTVMKYGLCKPYNLSAVKSMLLKIVTNKEQLHLTYQLNGAILLWVTPTLNNITPVFEDYCILKALPNGMIKLGLIGMDEFTFSINRYNESLISDWVRICHEHNFKLHQLYELCQQEKKHVVANTTALGAPTRQWIKPHIVKPIVNKTINPTHEFQHKAQRYVSNATVMVGGKINCAFCDKTLYKANHQQNFCDKDCKNKFWNHAELAIGKRTTQAIHDYVERKTLNAEHNPNMVKVKGILKGMQQAKDGGLMLTLEACSLESCNGMKHSLDASALRLGQDITVNGIIKTQERLANQSGWSVMLSCSLN